MCSSSYRRLISVHLAHIVRTKFATFVFFEALFFYCVSLIVLWVKSSFIYLTKRIRFLLHLVVFPYYVLFWIFIQLLCELCQRWSASRKSLRRGAEWPWMPLRFCFNRCIRGAIAGKFLCAFLVIRGEKYLAQRHTKQRKTRHQRHVQRQVQKQCKTPATDRAKKGRAPKAVLLRSWQSSFVLF